MDRRSLYAMFHTRCLEPKKRNKDGEKWIVHRFPIKGGITFREALLIDAARPNPFFRVLPGTEVVEP